MHAHHVSEVLVVRADLEHLEVLLVVPCRRPLQDVPEVDQGDATFIATIGQMKVQRFEPGEYDAREQVQHAEAKAGVLSNQHDQECRAEQAD